MYDQVRSEIESLKRSAIQPANNFFSGTEPDLFSDPTRRMDNRDPIRTGMPFPVKEIICTSLIVYLDIYHYDIRQDSSSYLKIVNQG